MSSRSGLQNELETVVPLLLEVKPTLTEVDVSRVLSACIFDEQPLHLTASIAPSHTTISAGKVTFMVQYIFGCRTRDDRSEHLDEHMRRMVEELADICSAIPCTSSSSV